MGPYRRPCLLWIASVRSAGLHGCWFTLILAGINILFLIFWAFAKSISLSQLWQSGFARLRKPGDSAELRGGLVTVSKVLFVITLTSAWLETQPFILNAMVAVSGPDFSSIADQGASSAFSGARFGTVLNGWFGYLTPMLAPLGAVFAVLSKYFCDIVAMAKRDSRWQVGSRIFGHGGSVVRRYHHSFLSLAVIPPAHLFRHIQF
jgi:hypothetical protein